VGRDHADATLGRKPSGITAIRCDTVSRPRGNARRVADARLGTRSDPSGTAGNDPGSGAEPDARPDGRADRHPDADQDAGTDGGAQ
jgi:hypothetical protein